MFVVAISIWVKPQFIASFKEAILDNARNTRKEPGNIRFDVLQQEDDPARFLLYEVYHTKGDLARHQQTEHFFRLEGRRHGIGWRSRGWR